MMHMPSSKTIYHEKDRFRTFSQNGDRLISGHFSTWGIQNVKFNITVCIKYGETEAKNSLKWHYSYRNLIKKLLTLCVGEQRSWCVSFFFLFGHVKDRINSNGGRNGHFGLFTSICALTDSRSSIEEAKITFPLYNPKPFSSTSDPEMNS